MLAILSDFADEQMHFNRSNTWRDGMSERVLQKRMNTIAEIAAFPFATLAGIQVQ